MRVLLTPADPRSLEYPRVDPSLAPRLVGDALPLAVLSGGFNELGLQCFEVDSGAQLTLEVHALLGEVQAGQRVGSGEALIHSG